MKALEKYLASDIDFAQEIISVFVENLVEFRSSLPAAVNQQDAKLFSMSCHKMKTTLGFTQNEKLQHQVDLVLTIIQEKGISGIDTRTQNLFCRICTNSIVELEEKLKSYKIPA